MMPGSTRATTTQRRGQALEGKEETQNATKACVLCNQGHTKCGMQGTHPMQGTLGTQAWVEKRRAEQEQQFSAWRCRVEAGRPPPPSFSLFCRPLRTLLASFDSRYLAYSHTFWVVCLSMHLFQALYFGSNDKQAPALQLVLPPAHSPQFCDVFLLPVVHHRCPPLAGLVPATC